MTDETLFAEALAIADAAERAGYLENACPDPVQRQRVAELLAAALGTNPLDRPPVDLGKTGAYTPESSDREPTAAVGDRVGPYKLLEKIGEGGMGEVWVADQLEPLKRRVALKLIKPGMDSRSVLGRFEAERQALAVMDHPNIAKVLDAGQTADGRPYFVMELVKGTPITEFADARKLTPKQRLELFVPVCQAIQHAHMKGIIHRDIKPSNVLVALHDEKPVPKVIDFGVAKAIGQQLTEKTIYTGFGALVGTPAYMAPEQATFNQLDVDTRADVYALGVLLYELLAGSPPLEAERLKRAALDEVLRIVRDEEPPRPSQRLSTSQAKASIAATRGAEPGKLSALMKGELDWIVMKALEKDRARRYDSANGFAADVQRYLAGEQVQAVPPSLGYRLRKAYKRNKAGVWVATAFTLVLLLTSAVSVWFGIQARVAQAKSVAEQARTREAFEKEQWGRRRFRAVYRTSSIDLFLTVYQVDPNGVELLRFQRDSWLAIKMIRTLTDDYLTETGTSPTSRAIRAEGLMWQGVDQYGEHFYHEALAAFRQAEEIYQGLVYTDENGGNAKADLATCQMLAAFAAVSAKRQDEADGLAAQVESTARSLVTDFPDTDEFQYELSLILWQLPTFRQMAGNSSPEPVELEESRHLLERLVSSSPHNFHFRTGLANVILASAAEKKRAGQPDEAVRLFGEAIAVLDGAKVRARDPIPMLRKWALRGRAGLHSDAGRHAAAAHDWERVVDEAPEPLINPLDRSCWAVALARSGDLPAARVQAERVKASKTFANSYWNAARVFAMSAGDTTATVGERERWAAAAVGLLGRCTDFYESPDDYKAPEFEPIKDRADFRKLVNSVRDRQAQK